MSTRNSAPARALTEHLGLCYGQTCASSMVRGSRGREYTFAQARVGTRRRALAARARLAKPGRDGPAYLRTSPTSHQGKRPAMRSRLRWYARKT